jgi:hypothetical protein
MSDLYLYHATDRKNLESIKQNGLLVNPPDHNWKDMYCDGKIFLALSAEVADDYAKSSDNPPENIVILKVKLDALNDNSFGYDWNNRCEYRQDINSCIYKSNIPGDLLQECNPTNEPYQEFDDFERTELYNILYDVFWEEVETNLERED